MEDQVKIRTSPRFKGRFFTWRVTVQNNHELGISDVLLVFSSGKRETTMSYLFHKLVWDELTKIELDLFILGLKPKNDKEWAFLKVLSEHPKKAVRLKLLEIERQLGQEQTSQVSYQGMHRIRTEIQKERRRLPKPPKFKGWIRSLAQRGKSSGPKAGIEPVSLDLPGFVDKQDEYELWVTLLTPSLASFRTG